MKKISCPCRKSVHGLSSPSRSHCTDWLFKPLLYLTVQISIIRASFEPIADFDEVGRWPAERNWYCTCRHYVWVNPLKFVVRIFTARFNTAVVAFFQYDVFMTIQNYQRDALNTVYSPNIITLLYMFRISSTHLQEDIVVHKQHMVPSLTIGVLVAC